LCAKRAVGALSKYTGETHGAIRGEVKPCESDADREPERPRGSARTLESPSTSLLRVRRGRMESAGFADVEVYANGVAFDVVKGWLGEGGNDLDW